MNPGCPDVAAVEVKGIHMSKFKKAAIGLATAALLFSGANTASAHTLEPQQNDLSGWVLCGWFRIRCNY